MTTTDPLARFGTQQTSQRQQVPGRTDQVKNNAGGYVFEIDPLSQLRRFLTIGVAGGTFYVGENALTEENGRMVIEMTKGVDNHRILVDEIVAISVEGRARQQNPSLFALAIACQIGETESKQYARQQITKVVRTGTHLFIFAGYLQQFGGWGRGLRKAVGNWYVEKDSDNLALQLIKYRQREGWTHRDVLRLTHPKVEGPGKRAAIEWTINGSEALHRTSEAKVWDDLPDFIKFFEMAQKPEADIPRLLENTYLPWEALPDSAMNDVKVWDKLLDNGMPINALVRQLPRLTRLGVLPPMGGGRMDDVIAQLLNPEAVSKSRIHPFSVLVALMTYKGGHSLQGSSTWAPSSKIVDALDEMYYLAFGNVRPSNKRTYLALDVSGSMAGPRNPKLGNLSPREIAAAMAMTTVRTEPHYMVTGFTDGQPGNGSYDPREASMVTDLPISGRQRLDDVVRTISTLRARATDCALPMLDALHRDLEVDTFVIYTDNETYYGQIHPFQALEQYRKSSGINSRLVVVSMTPTKFSIADPRDARMLDVSGFDSAVPQLISDFSAGVV